MEGGGGGAPQARSLARGGGASSLIRGKGGGRPIAPGVYLFMYNRVDRPIGLPTVARFRTRPITYDKPPPPHKK